MNFVSHKPSRRLVLISRDLAEDQRLSYRAKGLGLLLLSNLLITSEGIEEGGTEDKSEIKAALLELKDAGYARLVEINGEKSWEMHESPMEEGAVFTLDPTPPPKRKLKEGTVTGRKPELKQIETYCIGQGLTAQDATLTLLRWKAKGWPKNWMDEIRYWKEAGWMPSQKGGTPAPAPKPTEKEIVDLAEQFDHFIKTHPNPQMQERFSTLEKTNGGANSWVRDEFRAWVRRGQVHAE